MTECTNVADLLWAIFIIIGSMLILSAIISCILVTIEGINNG
jgi:hypothetical protein